MRNVYIASRLIINMVIALMPKPAYKNYTEYLHKFYGKGYTDAEVRSKARNHEGGWHGDKPMSAKFFQRVKSKLKQ